MIVYKYCDLCLNFLQFFVPVSWMLQNSESYLLSREWKKGEIKIKNRAVHFILHQLIWLEL